MTHTDHFIQLLGSDAVRAATEADQIDGHTPRLVLSPATQEQAAQALKAASAAGLALLPRGGGTKLGWGNAPARAHIIIDTTRLNQVIDHAWGDMTVTVQAGCTIGQLQSTLAEHGQRLATDPLWPERATVGGVLATNDSGMLRLRYGGLRDQVLGVTMALADGTLAKSGGRVVKNVAGYDLPKLVTGALGTLGLIVETTLRLYPLPTAVRELFLSHTNTTVANAAMLAVLDSSLAPAAIQLRVSSEAAPQLDLRFEGLPAALDDQQQRLATLTGGQPQEGASTAWSAREQLWNGSAPAIIARLSLLPADCATFTNQLTQLASRLRLHWSMVFSAVGTGWLRLEAANDEVLLSAFMALRSQLQQLGGTASAMGCPASLKQRIDVWGDPGDALPLMRHVKQRFDPQATLNPGRYVGRM